MYSDFYYMYMIHNWIYAFGNIFRRKKHLIIILPYFDTFITAFVKRCCVSFPFTTFPARPAARVSSTISENIFEPVVIKEFIPNAQAAVIN